MNNQNNPYVDYNPSDFDKESGYPLDNLDELEDSLRQSLQSLYIMEN